MKPFFCVAAFTSMCLPFCCCVGTIECQAQKTHLCQTITEGVLAERPFENMFLPVAVELLLEGDVPAGATPVSLDIQAGKITHVPGGVQNGPWTTCQRNGYCEDIFVPAEAPGNVIDKPLGDWNDGSRHYGVTLRARFEPQARHYTLSFARMILTYTMDEKTDCISQQSWEMAQGSIQKPEVSGRTRMLPEGTKFVQYATFGSSLKGAGEIWGPGWHNCDIWIQQTNKFAQQDQCEPNKPGVLTFSINWLSDFGYQVYQYQAKGIMFNCINSNEHRRACRAQITYK